jgi:DNA-directed RNA polymerase sigma subunit (sigma70/sigma32)
LVRAHVVLRATLSAELGAVIADGSPEAAPEQRVLEAIETANVSAALRTALDSLTQPERTIIGRRSRSDGRQPETSADIAEELALSRARVRHLQRHAEAAISKALRDPAA